MRTWCVPAIVVVAVLTGCGKREPVAPMATEGPNQVVLHVPDMT
jgi:hypothetical protein